MSTQVGSMFASLELQSANFISGLRDATKATDRATNSINKAMDRTAMAVKGFAAAFVATKAVGAAAEYLRIADAGKQMEAKLRLATAQMGNMAVAQRDVRDIAKETRSGLEETSSLYGKFLVASKDLGKGQADASRATETFSKALKIGGADAASAASATLQFGQALASGVLRGDEFNSVNEASPRIMRLLAESMGQPVGALRKMAEEGKLTSDVLFKALTDKKFTAGIDAEFKQLPATVDQAKTLMENSLIDLIDAFDRGSGISQGIVDGMGEGTTAMEDLVRTAEQAGIDIKANFEGLHDAFAPLLEGAGGAFAAIRSDADYTRQTIGNLLRFIDKAHNLYASADNFGTRIENGLKRGLNRAIDRAGGGEHFKEKPLVADWDMGGAYDKGYQESRRQSARDKLVRNIKKYSSNRDFTGKGMSDQQLIELSKTVKIAGPTAGTGKPTYKPPGKTDKSAADKAKRVVEKAQRDAQREVEKARRDLEAFKADKNRSEREELDSKAALASTATERFNFERQSLEQDKKSRIDQIDKDGPTGSKRYTQAQVDELKSIEERITSNRAKVIDLKESEFKQGEELKLQAASLDNAQEIAQLQSGMARTAKERRAGELRLLDLQMGQEKLALDAIIASRDATEADKAIARARLAMLPKLRDLSGKAIEQQTQGPLGQYLDAIPRTADEINEALEGVEVSGLHNLESGLMDVVKGVGSVGDAFDNMVDGVIDGLLRIALQQLIIKPLGSLLFGSGDSGGGGIFGSILSGITKGLTPGAKKANGGLGNRGRVLVGEHGPEILDMGGPYHVTPNSKLDAVRGTGGGGVNITFEPGSIVGGDPAQTKALVFEGIAQAMPMIAEHAKNRTLADIRRPRMS